VNEILKQFNLFGEVSNNFNKYGVLKVDNESPFINIPLKNVTLSQSQIIDFEEIAFTEFKKPEPDFVEVSASEETTETVTTNTVDGANQKLNEKINELNAEKDAARDVIIDLRKQLGESTSDSDFAETFPYLKK